MYAVVRLPTSGSSQTPAKAEPILRVIVVVILPVNLNVDEL